MENGRGISGLWVIVVLSLSPHVEHAFTTPTSQLGIGYDAGAAYTRPGDGVSTAFAMLIN